MPPKKKKTIKAKITFRQRTEPRPPVFSLVASFVVIATTLLIYGLLGGFRGDSAPRPPESPVVAEEIVPSPAPEIERPPALEIKPAEEMPPATAPKEATKISLIPNRLGYLNVRAGPGTNYKLLRQIDDEGVYEYTTVEAGWYRIILSDGAPGWIYGEYAEVVTNPT